MPIDDHPAVRHINCRCTTEKIEVSDSSRPYFPDLESLYPSSYSDPDEWDSPRGNHPDVEHRNDLVNRDSDMPIETDEGKCSNETCSKHLDGWGDDIVEGDRGETYCGMGCLIEAYE